MRAHLFLTIAIGLFAAGAVLAEKQPFERYQPILDRQMFGQLPPGFDPTKPPSEVTKASQKELTKEQEQLKSAIHFSVINITPDGETAVGFTDNSDPKAPVHYYLKVGEKRNGWEVQAADPQKASMTIAKGNIVVALELGANSAKTAGSTSAAPKPEASAAATGAGRSNLMGARPPTGAGLASARPGNLRTFGGYGSIRERRAQLAADKLARETEAAAKAKAEQAEREAEREANRQEMQNLKDELKAQREAAEQDRQERARKEQEEKERREREAAEKAENAENAENDA